MPAVKRFPSPKPHCTIHVWEGYPEQPRCGGCGHSQPPWPWAWVRWFNDGLPPDITHFYRERTDEDRVFWYCLCPRCLEEQLNLLQGPTPRRYIDWDRGHSWYLCGHCVRRTRDYYALTWYNDGEPPGISQFYVQANQDGQPWSLYNFQKRGKPWYALCARCRREQGIRKRLSQRKGEPWSVHCSRDRTHYSRQRRNVFPQETVISPFRTA